MSNIKIVTDSSVALTAEEVKTYGIYIVPLSVQIDGTVYEDGITIQPNEFLEKMVTSQSLPQTSQPAIGKFTAVYDEIAQQYPDDEILSLHLSSRLSGTIHAAEQAAALTNAKVTTFDTLSTDRGQAFMVIEAAKMVAKGATMTEILDKLLEVRDQTHIFLSFTSLNNMVAGGRLSKTQGMIGNLLNIKVGAGVDKEGAVEVLAKGRGMKAIAKFHDSVIDGMKAYSEVMSIGISHAGIPEVAEKMAARLQTLFPETPIVTQVTTPIVSTHTGAGALAIIYRAR